MGVVVLSDSTQVTWRHPHYSTSCLAVVDKCLLFVCVYLFMSHISNLSFLRLSVK